MMLHINRSLGAAMQDHVLTVSFLIGVIFNNFAKYFRSKVHIFFIIHIIFFFTNFLKFPLKHDISVCAIVTLDGFEAVADCFAVGIVRPTDFCRVCIMIIYRITNASIHDWRIANPPGRESAPVLTTNHYFKISIEA